MVSRRPSGAIRVLLADGDDLFTQTLVRTLSADERIDVVGLARDGREAVELAGSLLPDVVLMGIEIRGVDWIEATHRIRETAPSTRVLILTASDSLEDRDLTLDAGAAGFVRRDSTSAGLLTAILGLVLVLALDSSRSARVTAQPPFTR